VVVDVEDYDPENTTRAAVDKAKFVFRGQPKPAVTVPDAIPVDSGQ
jgi:ATP-dependent Clp protease ATP-binding subunit ClpC